MFMSGPPYSGVSSGVSSARRKRRKGEETARQQRIQRQKRLPKIRTCVVCGLESNHTFVAYGKEYPLCRGNEYVKRDGSHYFAGSCALQFELQWPVREFYRVRDDILANKRARLEE